MTNSEAIQKDVKSNSEILDSVSKADAANTVSFEACHKVLGTPELLEMILLCVYDPYKHFCPKLSENAQDHEDSDSASEADSSDGDTDSDASSEDDSSGSETESDVSSEEDSSEEAIDASTPANGDLAQENEDENAPPQFEDTYDQYEAEADMRTLLLCQRVNHMFKSTIDGSSKLGKHCNVIVLNPLLAELYAPFRLDSYKSHSDSVEVYVSGPSCGTESWRNMLVSQAARPMECVFSLNGHNFKFGPVDIKCTGPMLAQDMLQYAIDRDYEDYEPEFSGTEEERELFEAMIEAYVSRLS
ncbi:hypothetical protein Slin14017_G066180 [Septoria linicola]|nr:hypothetical protein Slin14017_G066180 [Septoria linicola]